MKNAAALLTLLPLVAAHGFVKSPPPRKPGNAFKAACGEQPFYQQSADINGNVQGIKQVVGSNFDAKDCNLWLCKGFQFDDNKDNVQSYKLGEKIDFDVNIAAPHTGYANVSVVKTSTDKMIGEPLIEFENYAANAGLNPNNTAFSVTLPESLGGECTKAGDCVLQWFWDAPDIDQTYESCVDFVVGGSGSGSGSGATKPSSADSAPVATSAPAAEKPATTLEAVAVTSSALGPIFESVTTAVPEPTAAPDAGDDEDCDDDEPVDEGDDEDCDDEDEPTPSAAAEPETGDDEDCDEEPETGDDDEECPADDGDEYDTQPATPSNKAQGISAAANTAAVTKTQNNAYPVPKPTGKSSSDKTGSGSKGTNNNNNAGGNNNYNNAGSNTVVTSYVTVAAETHYVTVTADAPACTA
jgi:hypothetical protein